VSGASFYRQQQKEIFRAEVQALDSASATRYLPSRKATMSSRVNPASLNNEAAFPLAYHGCAEGPPPGVLKPDGKR